MRFLVIASPSPVPPDLRVVELSACSKAENSLPITAAIGIVAALIGWWVAGKLGVQTTSGIDWLRWIISTIIAAVGIVIYGKVTSKA